MKRNILISCIIFPIIIIILLSFIYIKKTSNKRPLINNTVLSSAKYTEDINQNKIEEGLKKFIEWRNPANPSIKETEKLVNEYKSQLWNINFEYKKQMSISLFTDISSNYINNWASPEIIANFLNFWVNEEYKYNKYNYYNTAPIFATLLANIQTHNVDSIKKLNVGTDTFSKTIKEKYLKCSENKFTDWLIKAKSKYEDSNFSDNFFSLEKSFYISTKDYEKAIIASLDLLSINKTKVNYRNDPEIFEENDISDIAKYSELSGKVSIAAAKAIDEYYSLIKDNPEAIKYHSKSIRGKCIIDVVKKYDLLHGKPKDGYYYPVNDMKIKVESD